MKRYPDNEQWVVGPRGAKMPLKDLLGKYPKNVQRWHFSNVNDSLVNKMCGVKNKMEVNREHDEGDIFMSVDGTFGVRLVIPEE